MTESDGKSLSSVSPEFAKAIQWVQREVVIGLKKVVIVHLALKGYSIEDIKGFDLHMTAASAIDELYRIESWNTRAEIIANLKDTGLFPPSWILEHFTDMTPEEVKLMEIQTAQLQEKEAEAEPALAAPGELGALGEAVDEADGRLIVEYQAYEKRLRGNRILQITETMAEIRSRRKPEPITSIKAYVNMNELDYLGVYPEEKDKDGKDMQSLLSSNLDRDVANDVITETRNLLELGANSTFFPEIKTATMKMGTNRNLLVEDIEIEESDLPSNINL